MLNVIHRRVFNVTDFLTNRSPLIWVCLVCEGSQFEPDIPVRLIKIALFEFFDDNFLLDLKRLWIE